MKKALATISVVGACVFVACLPGDLRPEPGHVYVSVEGSDAAVNGFVTDDGWTIQFEKLLLGMGDTLLGGDDCEVYGEARYTRLFDLAIPGKQKLGELYGLNACNIQFRHSMPDYFAPLGNGVTVADRAIIFDLIDNKSSGHRVASTYVRGHAQRGTVTKVFAWRFREFNTFNECGNPTDGTVATSVYLKAGDDLRPIVTFHPEELFRDNIEADAELRFDLLAAADTNADGEVSLEEVSNIPAPVVELTLEELLDAGAPDGGYIVDDMSKFPGWARFMAQRLLVRAFRLDGHACQYNLARSKTYVGPQYPYDL